MNGEDIACLELTLVNAKKMCKLSTSLFINQYLSLGD